MKSITRVLGVLFSSNLKFDKHISNTVQKANNLTGIIKRTFNCLDQSMLQMLYTTLIRPRLDYTTVIWNPHQLGNIRSIEKVQRCATRMIQELKNHPYYDRLNALNLPSLVYRKCRMDMIMLYKITHGLYVSPFDTFFTYHKLPTRFNGYKLSKIFVILT